MERDFGNKDAVTYARLQTPSISRHLKVDLESSLIDLLGNDVQLFTGSPAIGIGGKLVPEVKNNTPGLDLMPREEYVHRGRVTSRSGNGRGSRAGVHERLPSGGPDQGSASRSAHGEVTPPKAQ